jgi:pimeloyl-ACP methyl ester carboxylesterase
MTTTTTLAPAEPTPATCAATASETGSAPRGHIGRIVTLTILGGAIAAVAAVTGPFAGAEEHVITGSVLLVFAASWALLAVLTTRRTDQPQRWAYAPAAVMAVAALTILVVAPTGNELGWVWPPAILALVAWMVRQSRHDLRSRVRTFILYPVFAALALAALGGAYETYAETTDPSASAMPGRLIDVGGHQLHLSCTGTGSPTVVLDAGMGEISSVMAGWIAPEVGATTRVCVYDRAGRGWSESAPAAQDGEQVATDLHTLLAEAGEAGPYVLAGHSAGGIYVLNFAKLFPQDVAGVALLDSMHPEQYDRMASWPGFYEMFRRLSAAGPSLSRLGVGRVVYSAAYSDLPAAQRDQERAFLSTPRHNRSARDEFHMIRAAMDQAAELQTLGDVPLVVLTALDGADRDWPAMQDDLMALSPDSVHRILPDASHAMVVEDEEAAHHASQAILEVVSSVRTNTPISAGVAHLG